MRFSCSSSLCYAREPKSKESFRFGLPTARRRLSRARSRQFWHRFWEGKLRAISWQGVHVYSRPLRYRNKTVKLPDGTTHTFLAGEEKGIDVRISLDVIRMVHRGECDVAVIVSQDQDLSEVATEIRAIAREQDRWIKIACAFPSSPTSRNRRGIDKTDWIRIDRATYDACLDRRDYRRGPPADARTDA